jgi:hypothetical protein
MDDGRSDLLFAYSWDEYFCPDLHRAEHRDGTARHQ